MTAEVYLLEAISCIDKALGKGYAKAHPDLIATFMQVSGQDFTMAIIVKTIGEAAEMLSHI